MSQTVLQTADVEEAILVGVGIARGQVVAGRLIERRERAEHPAAKTARHLRTEDRIDDAPRVNRRLQAVVVALSGEREDAGTLHEERTLLGKERREALVDLDLERVALDLAEIRIDRRIERHGRRDAVLAAEADVSLIVCAAPLRRHLPPFSSRIGCRRDDFANQARPQIAEGQRCLFLEDPLARGWRLAVGS